MRSGRHPKIGYWRWYSNNAGGSPNADVFVVDISNDGINWTNVETVGPSGSDTGGGWVYHEFFVADVAASGLPAQLRFIAADAGDGSIIEAAIDDLRIYNYVLSREEVLALVDLGDPEAR